MFKLLRDTISCFFCSVILSQPLFGNPSGGQVVSGDANMTAQSGTLTINQTSGRAIINWQGFSVGANEVTRFVQPSASSAVLNRVTGALPSNIDGLLEANGQVYLINPNGVVVGPRGRINTRGFVASTLDLADDAFMAGGDMALSGESLASVINLGEISATGGDVFLIARQVANSGTLRALEGTVGIASGREVLLTQSGMERLVVETGVSLAEGDIGVDNAGLVEAARAELRAAGGNIYALAVNNGGVIYANGLVNEGGQVLLEAVGGTVRNDGEVVAQQGSGAGGTIVLRGEGDASAVVNSGTLDAAGRTPGARGGTVSIAAARVELQEGTLISVDGEAGGGDVVVGSAGTRLVQAAEGVSLRADALREGDGGTAFVWSDDETVFAGNISARGGEVSGDGGFVEVSSDGLLAYSGVTDTRAPNGDWGTLLLDPDAILIDSSLATDTTGAITHYWNPGNIGANLASSNIELQAAVSIAFTKGTISWNTATTLTLTAPTVTFWDDSEMDGQNGTLSIHAQRTMQYADDDSDGIGGIDVATLHIYQNGIDPETSDFAGEIIMWGRVSADSVVLELGDPVWSTAFAYGLNAFSEITIDNPENSIANVQFLLENTGDGWGGSNPDPQGAFRNVDMYSIGNLTVDFQTEYFGMAGFQIPRTLLSDAVFRSEGDVILAAGSCIEVESGLHGPVFVAGGNFTNNSDANAFPDFFYVYSQSPLLDTTNGLSGTKSYDTVFNSSSPYGIKHSDYPYAAGQGAFAYTLAPSVTLTPSANWDYASTYGIGGADEPANAVSVSTSGLLAGDSISYPDLTFSTAARWDSDAGQYLLTIVPPADRNDLTSGVTGYDFVINAGVVTINTLPLTITVQDVERTYGEPNPTHFPVVYSGFAPGEDETVISNLDVSTIHDEQANVGLYADAIVASGGVAINYDITYDHGDLTIAPVEITITADDAVYHPGGAVPDLTVSYSGYLLWDLDANGDPKAAVLPETLEVGLEGALDIDSNLSLGEHYIQVNATHVPGSNYTFQYAFDPATMGVLTVTEQMTLLIGNYNRLYGEQNPVFAVSGEAASVVDNVVFDTTANQQSNVGIYAVTLSSFTAPDYHEITVIDGALQITPAPLVITAQNAAAVYGDALPQLNASVTGLMSWDSGLQVGLDLTVPPGRLHVGDHAIGVVNVDVGTNYDPTVNEGTLTITPANLIVVADDTEMIEDDPYPAFTASAIGLKYDDSIGVVQGLNLFSAPEYTPEVPPGYLPVTHIAQEGEEFILQDGKLTAEDYLITQFRPGTLVIKDRVPVVVQCDIETFEWTETSDGGGGTESPIVTVAFGIDNPDAQAFIEYAARLYLDSQGIAVRDVTAWLKDPANAMLVTNMLFELLSAPIIPGTELYRQREAFKTGLEQQIIAAKVAIAKAAVAEYEAWKLQQQQDSNRLLGLLGSLETPETDFVGLATAEYISSGLSVAALTSIGVVGGVMASQGLISTLSIASGVVNKITGVLSASSAAGTTLGIASGVIFAVTGTVCRALQLVEYDKVDDMYTNLVSDAQNFDIDTMIGGGEDQQSQLASFLLLSALNPTTSFHFQP